MLFYARMAGKRQRTMRDTDRALSLVSASPMHTLSLGIPQDSAGSLTTGNWRFPDGKEQLLFRGCSSYQSELYRNAFDIRHPSANSLSLAKPCFNLGSLNRGRPYAIEHALMSAKTCELPTG